MFNNYSIRGRIIKVSKARDRRSRSLSKDISTHKQTRQDKRKEDLDKKGKQREDK